MEERYLKEVLECLQPFLRRDLTETSRRGVEDILRRWLRDVRDDECDEIQRLLVAELKAPVGHIVEMILNERVLSRQCG